MQHIFIKSVIITNEAADVAETRLAACLTPRDLEGGSAGIFLAENNDLRVDKKNDLRQNKLRTKEGEALKSKEEQK